MVYIMTVVTSRLKQYEQWNNNRKLRDTGNVRVNHLRAGLFACTERESTCLELSSMSYAGDLNKVKST